MPDVRYLNNITIVEWNIFISVSPIKMYIQLVFCFKYVINWSFHKTAAYIILSHSKYVQIISTKSIFSDSLGWWMTLKTPLSLSCCCYGEFTGVIPSCSKVKSFCYLFALLQLGTKHCPSGQWIHLTYGQKHRVDCRLLCQVSTNHNLYSTPPYLYFFRLMLPL